MLASRDVQRHRTSKKELDDIRALIARDLADAGVTAVSADRRFATAYNAALLTAHMVIACAGYRVTAKTGRDHAQRQCEQVRGLLREMPSKAERDRLHPLTGCDGNRGSRNSRDGHRVSRIRRGVDRFELLESSALMHQSSPAMPQPLTSSRNSDAGSTALIESRCRANGR